VGAAVVVIVAGWWLEPLSALALSSVAAFTVGAGMLAVAVRSALRGDRLAWASVSGVVFMLVAVAGLSWIALHRDTPWPVHAASAVAGMAYLTVMAAALWARYSYLIELSEVLAHGPSYDPVTRMRSHSETTGQLVGDVFFRQEGSARPVGVVAICIANFYALENLHGRAAVNHALFICAGRLRRTAPVNAEMGRLGEDGFLVLLRTPADIERMAALARQLKERLSRPVVLSTRAEGVPQGGDTAWVAEVGVGVLATSTRVRPSQAVSTARAMARTAWSYGSRLAFYDLAAGQIAELPAAEGVAAAG
jgi:GGDEF domain-containing protein